MNTRFSVYRFGTLLSLLVALTTAFQAEATYVKLALFKSDGVTTVVSNQTITYQIVVTNYGTLNSPNSPVVDTFPAGTFAGVATAGDQPQQFVVTGDLTLRGTTRAITFPATIASDAAGLRSTATMEFSRWDFGLYPADATGPGDDGVDDRVLLDYDVRLSPAP